MGKYNAEKLKPCPFCGSLDIRHVQKGEKYNVQRCYDCRAKGPCIEFGRDWNTRHTTEPVVPLSEVLELLREVMERCRVHPGEIDLSMEDYRKQLKQKYGVSE